MKIQIIKATLEQKPILANLLELCAYDFTEIWDFDIGPEGFYGYKDLPSYWTDPNRHPYLVYVEGKIAGCALVQKGSPISEDQEVWDIAEFFILKKYRRKKVATHVAMHIWDLFKGRWQVRVFVENKAASLFWTQAIHQFTGQIILPTQYIRKKDRWLVFQFESL